MFVLLAAEPHQRLSPEELKNRLEAVRQKKKEKATTPTNPDDLSEVERVFSETNQSLLSEIERLKAELAQLSAEKESEKKALEERIMQLITELEMLRETNEQLTKEKGDIESSAVKAQQELKEALKNETKEHQELALICERISSPFSIKERQRYKDIVLPTTQKTYALAVMCQKLGFPNLADSLTNNASLKNDILAHFKLKILHVAINKLPPTVKDITSNFPEHLNYATGHEKTIATLKDTSKESDKKWIQFMLLKLFYFKGLIDGKEYMERILEFKLLELFKAQSSVTIGVPTLIKGKVELKNKDYDFGPKYYTPAASPARDRSASVEAANTSHVVGEADRIADPSLVRCYIGWKKPSPEYGRIVLETILPDLVPVDLATYHILAPDTIQALSPEVRQALAASPTHSAIIDSGSPDAKVVSAKEDELSSNNSTARALDLGEEGATAS